MLADLQQLFDAVESHLKAQFPDAALIGWAPEIEDSMPLPAILLYVGALRPGIDPGTGQPPINMVVEARVVGDPTEPNAEAAMWALAARLIKVLHHQTWGLPVTMAELESDGFHPDGMRPDLDGYSVIAAEWRHEFDLGTPEWAFEDTSGTTVDFDIQPRHTDADYELRSG
jgi:hypothetical protein